MLEELLKEARGWLLDCGVIVPRTPRILIVMVDAHYDGGWQEFVRADPSMNEAAVWMQINELLGLDFANKMLWAAANRAEYHKQ